MPKIDPLIASSCSNTALSHLNVPNFLNLAITLSHVQDYRHILQKIGTYSKCADLQNICACRFCIIPYLHRWKFKLEGLHNCTTILDIRTGIVTWLRNGMGPRRRHSNTEAKLTLSPLYS